MSNEKKEIITVVNKHCTDMAQLKASKNDLYEMELIFNSTQDALFMVKEENNQFVYVNNNLKHQELTGYSADDIIGKTPPEILGKDLGQKHINNFEKCFKTGETITFEEKISFRTVEKILLTKITPIITHSNIRYIVGSRVDITSLYKLNNEKEELLKRLRSMFEFHEAVMLLIEPYSGRIIDANPSAIKFYGYSIEELKTMNIQDINVLSEDDIEKQRIKALERNQKYFLFPHKLKSGEIRYVDVYSSPFEVGDKPLLYSIIFDVTEREKNREELFREKELLNITLDSIGDGVVTTDNYGCITRVNKAAKDITGWEGNEALGKKFTDIFTMKNELTGEINPSIIDCVLKTGKIQELANHTVLISKSGNSIPIADSAAPILNLEDKIHGAVMVFRDVSAEKEKKERILYLSYHDTLTGLFNRRFFDEEIKRIDNPLAYPLAIVMGDVNGLKMTNDVFGHELGDKLLKTIAEVISNSINSTDIAIRWGGDEFVIFMPHTNAEAVECYIAKMKRRLGMNSINNVIKMSVSFGYSVKENQEKEIDVLLQEAEEKMYRMKLLDSKSLRNSIINTVLATLYERSSETKEHADRLEKYCLGIGRELNLRAEELSELSLLSVLHDIGKIGVDQNILQKPGTLTDEEWVEMKRHSEIGYRIAQNIPELSNVSEYILSHHERWDGKGYPRGLKSTEVPLLCRILAVVDAFDAMISDRVYRKAMTKLEALRELKKNAGTQFDPQIVKIFVNKVSDDDFSEIGGEMK